jgi:hypothetical protein
VLDEHELRTLLAAGDLMQRLAEFEAEAAAPDGPAPDDRQEVRR